MRPVVVLLILLGAAQAVALNPGGDLLVPAAARVGTWVTDLYVLNSGPSPAAVSVQWLVRGQANPDPVGFTFTLEPGATRVLEDLILTELGLERGEGAFRVVADREVVVNARISSRVGAASFGQGFEGVPAAAATAAGETADVVGLAANAGFRTNLYALAGAAGAYFTVSLRDPDGVELASRAYSLGPYQPLLGNVLTELGGPQFDQGSLRVSVESGSVVVGASRVDSTTGDPATLEGSWSCGGGAELDPGGVYFGSVSLAGRERGFRLTVNELGEAVAVEFEMGSTRGGCNYVFPASHQLDPPLPLAALLDPVGISFTIPYASGQIEWTVRLVEETAHLHYSGVVSGVASGGPGSSACDGPTGDGQLQLGKQPL